MQPQAPFRFLRSDRNVDALCRRLAGAGLQCVSRAHDRLVYQCEWLEHPLEIVWALSWWPDGDEQEDALVSVVQAGQVRAEVDVSVLLREKLADSLPLVIIRRIAACCETITGKAARHPAGEGAAEQGDEADEA